MLSLAGFSLGPFLGDPGLGEAVDLSLGEVFPGLLNVLEISLLEADAVSCVFCVAPYLDDIQPGSFTLATFNFDVLDLEPGDSTLVFIDSVLALGDGFGVPLALDGTDGALLVNPAISVSAPPAALLLLAGLSGLGWKQRRLSARASSSACPG